MLYIKGGVTVMILMSFHFVIMKKIGIYPFNMIKNKNIIQIKFMNYYLKN